MGQTLLISILGLLLATGNQSPQETVQQFHQAQSAVQAAATKAEPHIKSVMDAVVMPAIDQVNADALPNPMARPKAAQKSVKPSAHVEAGTWQERSSFKDCHPYGDPSLHNIVCY